MALPQEPEDRRPCTIKDCDKHFCGDAEMARHIGEVHGEAKRCEYCSYTTKRSSRLRAHKEKKHDYKVVFEPRDCSILQDSHPQAGQIASGAQPQAPQQIIPSYGYPDPSTDLRYPQNESYVSIRGLESSLSLVSNSQPFDGPAALISSSQIDAARLGMQDYIHPPMILSSAAYNTIATNTPAFRDPNNSGSMQTACADGASQETDLSTDGSEKTDDNRRYT